MTRRLCFAVSLRTAPMIAAAALAAITCGCTISDCTYYGGADSNFHCVIRGPAPEGGYQ